MNKTAKVIRYIKSIDNELEKEKDLNYKLIDCLRKQNKKINKVIDFIKSYPGCSESGKRTMLEILKGDNNE